MSMNEEKRGKEIREKCNAIARSIERERSIFASTSKARFAVDEEKGIRAASLAKAGELCDEEAEETRERIKKASEVVEHEATKIGLLFAIGEDVREDVSSSALDSFHVSVIAFTACVNAWMGERACENGKCWMNSVQNYGEAVLKASENLVDAVSEKGNVRALVGNVWEKCKECSRVPKTGEEAIGKALMEHCRFIKDAKREIEEMMNDDDEENDDEENLLLEDDFGDEIVREEIKDVDRDVLQKVKVCVDATFDFLKTLVVPLIKSNSSSSSSSSDSTSTEKGHELDEIEKKCKEIRSFCDEIICEAMPPSDAKALEVAAMSISSAAEDMFVKVKRILTVGIDDDDVDNKKKSIETANEALKNVQNSCLKLC